MDEKASVFSRSAAGRFLTRVLDNVDCSVPVLDVIGLMRAVGLLVLHLERGVDVVLGVLCRVVLGRRPTDVLTVRRQVVGHVLQADEDRLVDQVLAEQGGHDTGCWPLALVAAVPVLPHRRGCRSSR